MKFNSFIVGYKEYGYLLEAIRIASSDDIHKGAKRGEYFFDSGGYTYRFFIEGSTDVAGIDWLDIFFSRRENNRDTLSPLNSKTSKKDVFGKVIRCILTLINEYNPENFRFVAGEKGLISMYDILLSMFSKSEPELKDYYPYSVKKYGKKYFYFTTNWDNHSKIMADQQSADEGLCKVFKITNKYLNESVNYYNVTLNWKGELHRYEDVEASSDKHAASKCIAALAKKLGKIDSAVRREVKGDKIKVNKVG